MTSSEAYAFGQLEPVAELTDDPVAAARAEADAIRAQAGRAGYEEGYRDGLDAARADLADATHALQAAAAEIAELRAAAADAVEREAISLALAVADKVVAGALEAKPALVIDVLAGALRGVTDREHVTVLVNPEDLETVRAALGDVGEALGGFGHLDVQAERRVGRGGAIVRTETGEIDATVATKLERVREAFAQELAG